MSDIVLAAMPYMSLNWPSIALGQLTAAARQAGLDAQTMYPIFGFAADIGSDMYELLSNVVGAERMVAEWTFAQAAYQDVGLPDNYADYLTDYEQNPEVVSYFERRISPRYDWDTHTFFQECRVVQRKAAAFIQRTAEKIAAKQPRIVGCSTTWMQYTPALALLRRIKLLDPSIVTMVGGVNCDEEPGYITHKKFPWIDFVVSGEADLLFPQLCRQILTNGADISSEAIPYGVYCRQKFPTNGHRRLSSQELTDMAETAIEPNLDKVPIPDYTDYFAAFRKARLERWVKPHLVMETSRGCWKGQRQPCTFCGFNNKRMVYRTKSVARVLAELETLSTRYGMTDFLTSDTVLNMKFFDTLFQELIKQGKNYRFMFETVSMLKEHHVKTMAAAGVYLIQPGIESLHDELLQLLHKGNSAIHSIALLKYCLEQGIKVTWNLLCGIPGDEERQYHEMAELLPALSHLTPPTFGSIRYDRFSVYHKHPEHFNLSLSPLPCYSYVYPFEPHELEHVVSFFQQPGHEKKIHIQGIQKVQKLIYDWQDLHKHPQGQKPILRITENAEESEIVDTRPCACSQKYFLTGLDHLVYQGCRAPTTTNQLVQCIKAQAPERQVDTQRIEESLQELLEKRLLVQIKGKYLALANYEPTRPIEEIFSGGCKYFKRKETKVIQNKTGFQLITT